MEMRVMFKQRAEAAFIGALENIRCGTFSLEASNGAHYEFDSGHPGPHGHMALHSKDVLWNATLKGDVGLAEDYRDGLWDSNNLPALVEFGLKNDDAINDVVFGSSLNRFVSQMLYLLRSNTKSGSKKNIQAHYDLGNDFYSLWLDETMTYSSAIFDTPAENLETAQHRKYDRILRRLSPEKGRILEVGCGWGGFAERALQNTDSSLTCITLSPSQRKFALDRLAGHENRVQVNLTDYRDQRGTFDSIVSIEMFEAVGESYWPGYFKTIKERLGRGGKALVQSITIGDKYFERYRRSADVIRTYIFPGGMLPSPSRFRQEAEKAGLIVNNTFFFGRDYAETLRRWLQNFDAQELNIQDLGFDQPFMRLWRFYLASCIGTFESDRTNVMQVELAHA
jgi:cyclopropane-fatty-acyl-phospholipid synthase